MSAAIRDIREMVEAVQLHSSESFSVGGERFNLSPTTGDLTSALAERLYQLLYCRPDRDHVRYAPDSRATRVFIDELSRANCGGGTWDPDWRVQSIEADGALVVHKDPGDLTVWARSEQFLAADPVGIGSTGRLRVGKELRGMLPGYYMVLGDAQRTEAEVDRRPGIVRFYWHLRADGAACWIRELTRRFNAAKVSFHAKVLSDPSAYARADAGVLYVESSQTECALRLLPELHLAIAQGLRPTTPMFTRRLARGLATAEDPGDGRSFGQYRCQLVAEGIVCADAAGKSAVEDVVRWVRARFAGEGLDVNRPWLNPGSRVTYAWPRRQRSR